MNYYHHQPQLSLPEQVARFNLRRLKRKIDLRHAKLIRKLRQEVAFIDPAHPLLKEAILIQPKNHYWSLRRKLDFHIDAQIDRLRAQLSFLDPCHPLLHGGERFNNKPKENHAT